MDWGKKQIFIVISVIWVITIVGLITINHSNNQRVYNKTETIGCKQQIEEVMQRDNPMDMLIVDDIVIFIPRHER